MGCKTCQATHGGQFLPQGLRKPGALCLIKGRLCLRDRLQALQALGEPTLVEVVTYRFRGHSMSDPGLYRTKDEVEEWKRRDPLNRSRARLTELGMSEDELQALEADVKAEIEDAVKLAEDSPAADAYFPYVVKE